MPGPRLTFFTGGTALAGLSHELARHTPDSVHLVTPFDSGGSSAALRQAFAMPAVGDLRNRLLALADTDAVPASVLRFCAARLPPEQGRDDASGYHPASDASETLRQALRHMGARAHPVWADMPDSFARVLRRHLNFFLIRMPARFFPFGACFGNLVLAGGYLRHNRQFGPVLAVFSRLLRARGVVVPIVEKSLHLAALLDNGSVIVGQHHFKCLPGRVRRIFLTVHEPDRIQRSAPPRTACHPAPTPEALAYLRSTQAICYPMGSFYSSVLANLLPRGVGQAVAMAHCLKIFIPNTGTDTEMLGLSLAGQTATLLRQLREDAPQAATEDLLHVVLVDSRNGRYEGALSPQERGALSALGVRLVERCMVREDDPQRHVPELTARALLELLSGGG